MRPSQKVTIAGKDMNSLMPPRLNKTGNYRADQIVANAWYYFLLESGDQIEQDWGQAADEILQAFNDQMPTQPKWWIDRRVASGMPNRPGKAVAAMKHNWMRFDAMQKEKLVQKILQISES